MNKKNNLSFNFNFLENEKPHAQIAKDSLDSIQGLLNTLNMEYKSLSLDKLEEKTKHFLAEFNKIIMYAPIPQNQLDMLSDEIALKLKDIAILLYKHNKKEESKFLLDFAYKFVKNPDIKKDFLNITFSFTSVYFKIILILLGILLCYIWYINNNAKLLGITSVITIMLFAFCFSKDRR